MMFVMGVTSIAQWDVNVIATSQRRKQMTCKCCNHDTARCDCDQELLEILEQIVNHVLEKADFTIRRIPDES